MNVILPFKILLVIIHRISPRNIRLKLIYLWINVLLHSGLQLFSMSCYSNSEKKMQLKVAVFFLGRKREDQITFQQIFCYILFCLPHRKGDIGGSCTSPSDWRVQSQGHSTFSCMISGSVDKCGSLGECSCSLCTPGSNSRVVQVPSFWKACI